LNYAKRIPHFSLFYLQTQPVENIRPARLPVCANTKTLRQPQSSFCFFGKNKMFSRRKQIVFPLKTNCFSRENKLFFQEKQWF
jgi:hypothetical protein